MSTEIKKDSVLDLASAYADKSIEYKGYAKDLVPEYIAGERFNVSAENSKIIIAPYGVDAKAEIVTEQTTAQKVDVTENVTVIDLSNEESIRVESRLAYDSIYYEDDKESIGAIVENQHAIRGVNAENKYILSMLTGAKDPIVINTVAELITKINDNLCGRAKRNAVIYTNKDGFKALDIMVNGVSLVKRIDGAFIFCDKYIIKEYSAELLPNIDNNPPFIVGDVANIVKVAKVGGYSVKDVLSDTDIYDERKRVKIIPALATVSDKAFIVCTLSTEDESSTNNGENDSANVEA